MNPVVEGARNVAASINEHLPSPKKLAAVAFIAFALVGLPACAVNTNPISVDTDIVDCKSSNPDERTGHIWTTGRRGMKIGGSTVALSPDGIRMTENGRVIEGGSVTIKVDEKQYTVYQKEGGLQLDAKCTN